MVRRARRCGDSAARCGGEIDRFCARKAVTRLPIILACRTCERCPCRDEGERACSAKQQDDLARQAARYCAELPNALH